MKHFIQKLLAKKAHRLIEHYHPQIIAITGSIGKTSTKTAIATILENRFRMRVAKYNYNNEIGVPLAILGKESPGTSLFGWLRLLCEKHTSFPDILVLEFGADHPGDIQALCKLAPPSIGVLTGISPVHVENYDSLDQLIEEKSFLLSSLPQDGYAVLNADDEHVWSQREKASAPAMGYGFSQVADLRATGYDLQTRLDHDFDPGESFAQVVFCVESAKDKAQIVLSNTIGKPQVSAILAALAVGSHLGLSFQEMAETLQKNYGSPCGRLKPLAGIKGSLILDDTYNAAPASMLAALEALREFEPYENRRRIAVLGDMAELGALSESEHRRIGLHVFETAVDLLVCVGEKAKDMGRAAQEAGMKEEAIVYFQEAKEAGRFMDRELKQGDIILVKGSQSMRMEKVVKEIMAEPLRAEELLVRQYGKWVRD